jgi:hypothetical protein
VKCSEHDECEISVERKVLVKQGGPDTWAEWERPLNDVVDELERRLGQANTAATSFEVVEVEVRKRRVLRRTVEILGEDK